MTRAFEEGEQEYAEEFRKKLSLKNLSDFMNLMSSPYRYPYGRASTGEGYRRVGYRQLYLCGIRDRLVKGQTENSDENEYGISEIERINI